MNKLNIKKALSVAISVLGVILFIYGSCMSNETTVEKDSLSQVENTPQHRSTLGPFRRSASVAEAENKQEMLNQGEQRIASAQVAARWLQGIGVVVFIIGIGGLVLCYKRNN